MDFPSTRTWLALVLCTVFAGPAFAGVELFPKVYEPLSAVEVQLSRVPRGTIFARKLKIRKSLSVQFMSMEKSGGATQYVAQIQIHYVPASPHTSLRQGDRDEIVVMAGAEAKTKDGSYLLVLKPTDLRHTWTRGLKVTFGDHGDLIAALTMYGGFSALVHERPVIWDEHYTLH